MTIQTTDGPIVMALDDVQLMHRGKTLGIKLRILSGTPYIMGVRKEGGVWQTDVLLDDETFVNSGITPETEVAKYGSAREWVRKMVLPLLQNWLTGLFHSSASAHTALEQIEIAIKEISFKFNDDGTVTVSL